jgi:hypothetical protein
MIQNILAFVRLAPLAIFPFVAIAGAFAALIGGLAGWVEVAEFGKMAAGGGALGFFAWLCLPILIRAF